MLTCCRPAIHFAPPSEGHYWRLPKILIKKFKIRTFKTSEQVCDLPMALLVELHWPPNHLPDVTSRGSLDRMLPGSLLWLSERTCCISILIHKARPQDQVSLGQIKITPSKMDVAPWDKHWIKREFDG